MPTIHDFITPPLKEIVLSVSFHELVSQEILQQFSRSVQDDFPIQHPGFEAFLSLNNMKSKSQFEKKPNGFLLLSAEKTEKLVVRMGSLTLHLLERYVKFEELLDRLKTLVAKLHEYKKATKVSHVTLRYLNEIDLDEIGNLNDAFNINIDHPFSDPESQLHRFTFVKNDDARTNVIVTISSNTNNAANTALLDIILARDFSVSPITEITQGFEGLREMKNDYFSQCISIKTLKKYCHE